MLLAYHQRLDPLRELVPGSAILSTMFAALPVLVLFWLLVPRRWLAPKAGAAGAVVAIVVAIVIYGMPVDMALMSFVSGVGFGLLPVGWTIFTAMLPAYYAKPASVANPPVILVAMEIFGLHEYIRDVTRRWAKAGAFAVAPDYYFRAASYRDTFVCPEAIHKLTILS